MRKLTTVPFLIAALLFSMAPANAVPPVFNGNVQSAGNPIFNIKFYGAKGDATTDDSAAIQAAITAAVAAGGEVYCPVGRYKIGSPLTINIQGNHKGGFMFLGAGRSQRGSVAGCDIEPSYQSGDVFIVQQNTSNFAGGVTFRDFDINRVQQTPGNAQPTSGAAFNLQQDAAAVVIDNVDTWQDYDDIILGYVGGSPAGNVKIVNSDFETTIHKAIQLIGTYGNIWIEGTYFSGDSTIYNGAKTSVWFDVSTMANTDLSDLIYLHDVDVEQYAKGFNQTSGRIVDLFSSGLVIDTTSGGHAFNVSTPSGAVFSRIKLGLSYFFAGTGFDAVHIDGGGHAGTTNNGVDEVTISDSNVASGGYGIYIANGPRDVILNGNQIFSNPTAGIYLGGTSTTSRVTISGNRIGDVYGTGNGSGIVLQPAASATLDKVSIVGNDLTGNTNYAVVEDNSAASSTLGDVLIAGNTTTGYSTPFNVVGTQSVQVKIGENNGSVLHTSTATSGTRFQFNALTTVSNTDKVVDFQSNGNSLASLLGSGAFQFSAIANAIAIGSNGSNGFVGAGGGLNLELRPGSGAGVYIVNNANSTNIFHCANAGGCIMDTGGLQPNTSSGGYVAEVEPLGVKSTHPLWVSGTCAVTAPSTACTFPNSFAYADTTFLCTFSIEGATPQNAPTYDTKSTTGFTVHMTSSATVDYQCLR